MSCYTRLTLRCALQEGKYAVNTALQEVEGPRSLQVLTDRVVLNHYVTKSLDDFLQKVARGSGMGNHKTMDFFREVQASASRHCKAPEYSPSTFDASA